MIRTLERTLVTALLVTAPAGPALAGDPLAGGSLRNRISGPELEAGSLEGKVVLLEYFGFR